MSDNMEEGNTSAPFRTNAYTSSPDIEEDYGPIEAYVKDDYDDDVSVEEIDDENVNILPSSAEVARKARSKLKLYSIIGSMCILVTVVAVMVPVGLTVLKTETKYTQPPTQAPSVQPSQAPTDLFFTDYVDAFAGVSDRTLINTPGTAQYRASRWIYNFDPVRRDISDSRLLQRYIAAVFYYSTSQGYGWLDCYPGDVACTSDSKEAWFSSHDECNWFGFTECDRDGHVTRFVILNNQNGEGKSYFGNNLHGTLPPEFGYLTTLTDLTIVMNKNLASTIPLSFSKLTSLRRLRLFSNSLEGPWNKGILQNMTDLMDLVLHGNNFNITLPYEIGDVKSLRSLSLAGNKFHGDIPKVYGELHRLETLELQNNELTGEIPPELFLPNLRVLSLENNSLSGTVSETICNLTEHQKLNDFNVDCDKVECSCCKCEKTSR